MSAVLTTAQFTNERRLRRLRDHYVRTLTQREHLDLIEHGEEIRREWHRMPIPRHRALMVWRPR